MGEMMLGDLGGIGEGGSGFNRHDTPARNATEDDPASSEYSDLTEGGVEHAKMIARTEILEMINDSEDGTVVFIGGKSDQKRAGQTAEIWGEALSEIAEERSDLVVLTKQEIDQRIAQSKEDHTGGEVTHDIQELVNNNPDKKIVIDYPLFIKQLGYGYQDRWTTKNPETGKVEKTEYFSEILKKHNNDHAESIHDWLENDGVLTAADGRTIQGPRPEDVAKQYLQGLERLYRFSKNQFPDRNTVVRAVGHQWDLDAVATYLAKGRVTYEDWSEVMGRPGADKEEQVIGEGEGVNDIAIDPKDGKMTVKYRGQEFTFNPKKDEEVEFSKEELDGVLKEAGYRVESVDPKYHLAIAKREIAHGNNEWVVNNLDRLKNLDKDVAKSLIAGGYVMQLSSNLKSFEHLDAEISDQIRWGTNDGFTVAQHLDRFDGLSESDKEMYERMLRGEWN